jgi:hypothetical protein
VATLTFSIAATLASFAWFVVMVYFPVTWRRFIEWENALSIRGTALYCYNLACYEAQLGCTESAKALLQECLAKDATMKATALDDPDLESAWDSLG